MLETALQQGSNMLANPATEIVVAEAQLLELQQEYWQTTVRKTTASQRIDKLNNMRKWIVAHQDDIRKALFDDFRKPEPEVDTFDIKPVLGAIEEVKTHLVSWMTPKNVQGNILYTGTTAQIVYEPKGVALIIAPWNFPFMLALEPLVSAIAAGCCAVVKPSEMTPNTAQLLYKMLTELFDEREVAVRLGDALVSQALLKQPFDHIFFTGSPQIGKHVMRAAAEHLTSVTLELGGMNPVIIDESADIRDTAEKLIWGKFLNCGQSCLSINYVLANNRIYDRLIKELQGALERLYGNPELMQNNPDFARIVNNQHYKRVKKILDNSLDAGAKLVAGGVCNPAENYISPTILKDVPLDAAVFEEEIFGPILPISKYKDIEEVISIINARPKPLAVYIFAKTDRFSNNIIAQTSAGTTCINDTTIQFAHPGLPFGGSNYSGIGKAHGHYGFLAFSNERSVLKQRRGITSFKLVYPPYTQKVKQAIQLVMKYL
ncbi:MAG: hypothetical protein RI894_1581 [Bacteroidota bacterium]|jgi:aldehyde dehydrogenase (NAD+)